MFKYGSWNDSGLNGTVEVPRYRERNGMEWYHGDSRFIGRKNGPQKDRHRGAYSSSLAQATVRATRAISTMS